MRRRLTVLAALATAVLLAAAVLPGSAPGWGPASAAPGQQAEVYLPYVIGRGDTPSLTPTPSPSPTPTATSTPTPSPTPTATPTPSGLVWDPRLDQRGAFVIPAQVQPGESYWRLVKGVWYAENEPPFAGQRHIFVDALTGQGSRQTGVSFEVTSLDGLVVYGTIITEPKPGELYAANFPMYVVAPAYRVTPSDGSPGDAVSGLGLGSIELPDWTIHTSYGFVWQWSVAEQAAARLQEMPEVHYKER